MKWWLPGAGDEGNRKLVINGHKFLFNKDELAYLHNIAPIVNSNVLCNLKFVININVMFIVLTTIKLNTYIHTQECNQSSICAIFKAYAYQIYHSFNKH